MLSRNRREEIISRFLKCSCTLASNDEVTECLYSIKRVYGIGHAVECEEIIRKLRSQSYIKTDLIQSPEWESIRNDRSKRDIIVSEEINDRKEFFNRKVEEFKPDVLKKQEPSLIDRIKNFKPNFLANF